MPRYEEITIRHGSQGLVTNISAADADKASFRTLKNVNLRTPGLLKAFPGAADTVTFGTTGSHAISVAAALGTGVIPALPSNFVPESFFVFHKREPSDSDCIIAFGSMADPGSPTARDRFYVWPAISNGVWTSIGTYVSDINIGWLELTEMEGYPSPNNVDVVTDATHYTIQGLANTEVLNYYKGWWVYNTSLGFYDLIISSVNVPPGSGTAIVTAFGTTLPVTTNAVIVMRNPVFKKNGTAFYQIDGLPVFVQHGENITIHTGAHDINNGADLWLGYVGNSGSAQGFFNDSNLDFNGWYFDSAHPWPLVADGTTASSGHSIAGVVTTVSGSTNAFPYSGSGTDKYALQVTALYEGLQESRIDPTTLLMSGFGISAANQHITVVLRVNPTVDLERASEYGASSTDRPVWNRRIRKLRIYLAQTDTLLLGIASRPTTDFFFVKEIDVDDSSWSFSSGEYVLTATIYGSDWFAGQAYPFAAVNGFEAQKLGANASFGVAVAGRAFVGPVYDDTLKNFRILFSPIRLSGETAPNVLPPTNRIDLIQYGIYTVKALVEHFGRLVIFGEETTLIADVSGEGKGLVVEQFQKMNCVSGRTVKSVDGMLYFSSKEHMLEIFDGNRVRVPSPGFALQDIWDGFTLSVKEAAFAGYHRLAREYWLAIGSGATQRIFIYDILLGVWTEYLPSFNAATDLAETPDGELLCLRVPVIHRLRAPVPVETLAITIETQVFNTTRRHYRRVRCCYKSPSVLTVTPIDDEQVSALREKRPVLFLSQTSHEDTDREISMETSRAALKITRAASTDTTMEIDSIAIAGRQKRER